MCAAKLLKHLRYNNLVLSPLAGTRNKSLARAGSVLHLRNQNEKYGSYRKTKKWKYMEIARLRHRNLWGLFRVLRPETIEGDKYSDK